MAVIEHLMQRAQFTTIVVAAVLAVVGLPRSKARYRILTVTFVVLSLLAALQWYTNYLVAGYYFRERTHWPLLAASILFVSAAVLFAYEAVRLPVFTRLTPKHLPPNQSPQRNAGSRPSSGGSPAAETPSSTGPRG